MRFLSRFHWLLVVLCTGIGPVWAEDAASTQPKPVPQTRPEMKRALEKLKQRQPRLPLPPVENAETGTRPSVNNGRMRSHYLPAAWSSTGRTARPAGTAAPTEGTAPRGRFPSDPSMTLDNTFKVKLFWIVSRGNNCHYCLGHQELKLRSAGVEEDAIAALDSDWSVFPDGERAALDFTRKLTLTPHLMGAADLDRLRPYFNDVQLVELVHTVASYNSTNRWTDSLGIPQDQQFGDEPTLLETPTSAKFGECTTQIVPVVEQARPALESREQVLAALAACREREPRVALASEEKVREAWPKDWPAEAAPQWFRALASFPTTAQRQLRHFKALAEEGRISPVLKAQIAWIAAREDRAWYAAGQARQRLAKLGIQDDQIFALDGDGKTFSPAEYEAFAFTRKLTARPRAIADDDIARLRKLYSDNEVAEIVYVVCAANAFDRFTETLGLTLEE
jgi:alkylhydroperoxidase family enzyme